MKLSNRKSILIYSIVTITLASIICFIAYSSSNINISILSVLTPLIVAVILTSYSEGKEGLKKLFVTETKKISLKWIILSLLALPFFAALSMLTELQFDFSEFSLRTTQLLPQVIVIVVIAIGEEYGWRAYLLPKLMTKYNVFTSGIISGFIWGIWHFPGYLIGTGTPLELPFAIFMIWVVIVSLIMAWAYYYTRSVLSAIFIHISANAAFNYLRILPEFTGNMTAFYIFMGYTAVFTVVIYALKKELLKNS